ncbi:MAG: SH3 domain-containing protein, partial [Anaerolineae bacterium]|nr:SH3 domain-containing protein [Anaerolineae bacterium]
VLFYAQPGAGKSSLVNAALIPGLRAEGFAVLPTGRVGGAIPEGVGEVANVFLFSLLLSLDGGRTSTAQLAALSLSEYLAQVLPHRANTSVEDGAAHILIIDQFEEILTTNLGRWSEREGFFSQLRAAMGADPLLWVLLVMREDHVAALEPYTPLLPDRLRARFYMQRMQLDAALLAVEKPAQKADRPFAMGVARALVDNLRQIKAPDGAGTLLGEYVEPVQLQVVCFSLWQKLAAHPGPAITFVDLQELGEVDAALADFYEGAVAAAALETQASEASVRQWFEQSLLTEGGTRGTVYRGRETTAGLDNAAVDVLADRFLLRPERRAGGVWYELIHDRFIEPIRDANRRWLLQHSPVYLAAVEWERLGRPPARLLRGEQLAAALEEVNLTTAEPTLRTFLESSAGAERDRERAEIEARLAAQRQRTRRLTFIATAFVLLGSLALAAAGFAFIQQGRARASAHEAQAAAATSQANEQLAVARLAQAQAEQGTAIAAGTEAAQANDLANTLLEAQAATLEAGQTAEYAGPTGVGEATELVPETTATASRTPDASAAAAVAATQLLQIRATQAMLVTPTPPPAQTGGAMLSALLPPIPLSLRSEPAAGDNVITRLQGPARLPVQRIEGDWILVSAGAGQTGWLSGYYLTFIGNADALPRALRYRVLSDRDDLPYVYGQVVSVGGANGAYLLYDPASEKSDLVWIPTGTEVTLLLPVQGARTYGSSVWYLVELVDPRDDEKLVTGYLPAEMLAQRRVTFDIRTVPTLQLPAPAVRP